MAVPGRCRTALHSQPPSPPSGSTLYSSARARPRVGGAEGVCLLFPEPDWLVLPQRGDVFRSTLCFRKEARELHRSRSGRCGAVSDGLSARAPAPTSRGASARGAPRACGLGEKGRGIPAPCNRFKCLQRGEHWGARATWVGSSPRLDVPPSA